MPTCDICSKPISGTEMITLPAGPIVSATMAGYFPRRTPAHYRLMDPATQRTHWSEIVKVNSACDWGLCGECHTDILAASKKPEAATIQSDMEGIASMIRSRIAADPKLAQFVNERLGSAPAATPAVHTPPPPQTSQKPAPSPPAQPEASPALSTKQSSPTPETEAKKSWWQFWK